VARRRVQHEDWPRLTRFYGIGPAELANTPHNILRLYAEQLDALQAEEQIMAITAVSLPNQKQDVFDSAMRKLRRRAGFEVPAAKVDASTEEGKAVLAGLGIGSG